MPNRSQIFTPDVPVHVVLRSNKSRPCFYASEDYRYFLQCLHNYIIESSCAVHAYALMSNHVHLLLTPAHEKSIMALIELLGESYTNYINETYRKNGSLLGKRFNCYMIHEDEHFLDCQRYIELNPVRAKIVSYPGEYPWSSYRANAHGIKTSPLTPHHLYLLLGNSRTKRMDAYRDLFNSAVNKEKVYLTSKEEEKHFEM